MQIDIITKNAVVLQAKETRVIAISNELEHIEVEIIIKSGDKQRLYKLLACKKAGEIKTRIE